MSGNLAGRLADRLEKLQVTVGDLRAPRLAQRLERRNRESAEPVVGDAPVIVSLTSHGARLDTVHLTIESIAAGSVRPRRLILWLDDPGRFAALPEGLRRLQERGLEMRLTRNLGPHTKYYPALAELAGDELLVTADDDLVYPLWWLSRLFRAAQRRPGFVHAHRVRVVRFTGTQLARYADWPLCATTRPSLRHLATGVSGVIYPRALLVALIAAGEGFRSTAPRADDIWLHRVAVDAGVRVCQVAPWSRHFPYVPGSQVQSLMSDNVAAGGNDPQIAATYRPETIARLAAEPA